MIPGTASTRGRKPTSPVAGYFSPAFQAKQLERRLTKGGYRMIDGELEKRCPACKEWWPADTEFFFPLRQGGDLHSSCKACYLLARYPERYPDQVRGQA